MTDIVERRAHWSTLSPARRIQLLEEKLCTCGAAGSGEGHCEWCDAKKFDRIPKGMSAEDALVRLGYI